MKRNAVRHKPLDIYTELCPASSMAILGAGLVTATMGEGGLGAAVALIGIALGVAGPVTKTMLEHKISKH